MYILTPFFVAIYRKSMKNGHTLCIGLILLSLLLRTVTDIEEVEHRRTHLRFGPYLVGIIFYYLSSQNRIAKKDARIMKTSLAFLVPMC